MRKGIRAMVRRHSGRVRRFLCVAGLCLTGACRVMTGLDELQFGEDAQASLTCREKVGNRLGEADIVGLNERCYALAGPSSGWQDARMQCLEAGMYLASPAAAAELTNLSVAFQDRGIESFWLGGAFKGAGWAWDSGEPWNIYPCTAVAEPTCDIAVNLWQSAQPDGSGFCLAGRYVSMADPDMASDIGVLRLDDVDCSVLMSFLCEMAL